MANRVFELLRGVGKDRIMLHGRFAPAGTGAVTGVQGAGFSVARTGVGTFTVTLQDRYPALLFCNPTLFQATPTNQYARVGTYTPASGSTKTTLTILTWDPSANSGAGGAFDVAANAANYVTFQLVLNNSTITLGG